MLRYTPKWHAPELTLEQLAEMLNVEKSDVHDGALWIDTGSEQLLIPLASAAAVERCRPSAELLARYSVGSKRQALAYVWARNDDRSLRVRFFFSKFGGVVEDPGTGSACANLGGWFIATQSQLPIEITLLQGDQVGRPCRLGLRVDGQKRVFVSGRVIEIARGEVTL